MTKYSEMVSAISQTMDEYKERLVALANEYDGKMAEATAGKEDLPKYEQAAINALIASKMSEMEQLAEEGEPD